MAANKQPQLPDFWGAEMEVPAVPGHWPTHTVSRMGVTPEAALADIRAHYGPAIVAHYQQVLAECEAWLEENKSWLEQNPGRVSMEHELKMRRRAKAQHTIEKWSVDESGEAGEFTTKEEF